MSRFHQIAALKQSEESDHANARDFAQNWSSFVAEESEAVNGGEFADSQGYVGLKKKAEMNK